MQENAQNEHAPGQVRQKEGTYGESSSQPPLSFPLALMHFSFPHISVTRVLVYGVVGR